MRVAIAILLASVSFAALGQAASADTTQSAAQIRVVPYSPLLRTEIIGVVGQPTTITFPPGESVYRVVQTGKPNKDGALADAGWQGAAPSEIKDTPLGNNLTLWPVMPGESTMTVITMSSAGASRRRRRRGRAGRCAEPDLQRRRPGNRSAGGDPEGGGCPDEGHSAQR